MEICSIVVTLLYNVKNNIYKHAVKIKIYFNSYYYSNELKENRGDIQKNKMINLNPIMLIIILNVKGTH